MLLRALQPVDLTVASLEEATQVVALLRALSRHRQTWTFAMPAQRQTELLESARLLLRDLSIVIDPRSTDSPLQFRAVSPDERWKEENQRSKKRFQRAFKKLSGLSLMKRLKSKLGGSSKKSGILFTAFSILPFSFRQGIRIVVDGFSKHTSRIGRATK